jgi:acetoin utilization deacetylase AcuC-like enzyme
MKLSTADMLRRDQFVLKMCRGWQLPTCIVYGGGYNRTEGMTAKLHVQTIRAAAALT